MTTQLPYRLSQVSVNKNKPFYAISKFPHLIPAMQLLHWLSIESATRIPPKPSLHFQTQLLTSSAGFVWKPQQNLKLQYHTKLQDLAPGVLEKPRLNKTDQNISSDRKQMRKDHMPTSQCKNSNMKDQNSIPTPSHNSPMEMLSNESFLDESQDTDTLSQGRLLNYFLSWQISQYFLELLKSDFRERLTSQIQV